MSEGKVGKVSAFVVYLFAGLYFIFALHIVSMISYQMEYNYFTEKYFSLMIAWDQKLKQHVQIQPQDL